MANCGLWGKSGELRTAFIFFKSCKKQQKRIYHRYYTFCKAKNIYIWPFIGSVLTLLTGLNQATVVVIHVKADAKTHAPGLQDSLRRNLFYTAHSRGQRFHCTLTGTSSPCTEVTSMSLFSPQHLRLGHAGHILCPCLQRSRSVSAGGEVKSEGIPDLELGDLDSASTPATDWLLDLRAALSLLQASCSIHSPKGAVGEGAQQRACRCLVQESTRAWGLLTAPGMMASLPGILTGQPHTEMT